MKNHNGRDIVSEFQRRAVSLPSAQVLVDIVSLDNGVESIRDSTQSTVPYDLWKTKSLALVFSKIPTPNSGLASYTYNRLDVSLGDWDRWVSAKHARCQPDPAALS